MKVGTRLRRLRVAKGLTQKELAAPRYSHAYVSTIEAGRRVPSRAALEHFGAKLGVPVDELVTGRPVDLDSRLRLQLQEARILVSAGHLDEAEDRFADVQKTARKFDLHRLVGDALEGQGLCLERRGRLEEAIARFDEALDILRDDNPIAATESVAGKARCVHLRGDINYAIFLLENHLERILRDGFTDPASLVRIYASLVKAYFDRGLFTKAGEAAAEAMRLAPRVEDPARLAQMHVNLTGLLIHRGDLADAEAALVRAQDLYRQADLQTELGRAYLARGYVLARAGNHDEARELFLSAHSVFAQTRSSLDEARVLNELARLDRLDGRIEQAIERLNAGIELLRENDVAELATSHRELALCYLERDPADAEKHLRMAIDLFERAEENVQLAASYRALGDLLHERGDGEGGCDAYRTGIVLLEERL